MTVVTQSRSHLCLVLTCAVALTATASAQPFPSFLLDTTRVIGADYDRGYAPYSVSVAFADSVGLVVWPSDVRVKACRVDRGLALLDTVCLDISGASGRPAADRRAGVASNGRNFLVAWAYSHEGGTEHLKAAVVSQIGRVETRLEFAPPCYMTNGVSVSSDGMNYIIAWTQPDAQANTRVLFVRVTPEGQLLDSTPRLLCPALDWMQDRVDVTAGDSCYMAVWMQRAPGIRPAGIEYSVWGNIIRSDGTLIDSAGFPVARSTGESRPAVTFDGANFVSAWQQSASPFDAMAARVTPRGAVLDPAGIQVAERIGFPLDVCSAGDTTMVAWTSWELGGWHLLGRRLDGELRWLDTVPVRFTPADPVYRWSYCPAIGVTDDDFLVAWLSYTDSAVTTNQDVVGRRLTRGGLLPDTAPVLLSYAANAQQWGDVASDGSSFLAVWTDCGPEPGSPERVRGARFDAPGVVLDQPALSIGDAGSFNPAVAFGGGCYLVCWQTEDGAVSGARVSVDGMLLDTVPIRVRSPSVATDLPDVAYTDDLFLVVWKGWDIEGARVTPAGILLDSTPLDLQQRGGRQYGVRVAGDGHNFFTTRDRGQYPGESVLGLRVSPSGEPLEPEEIRVSRHGGRSDVAFGAGVYYVDVDGWDEFCLVSPEGIVLNSEVSAYPGGGYESSVAFNGTDFLLVGKTQGTDSVPRDGLKCVRISPQGVVLDTAALRLVDVPDECVNWSSAAASDSFGNVAVLFSSFESLGYMTCRIRALIVPAGAGLPGGWTGAVPCAMRVYPNPCTRYLTVDAGPALKGQGAAVELVDVAGRRVLTVMPHSAAARQRTIDLRGVAPGVYYLRAKASPMSIRVVVAR